MSNNKEKQPPQDQLAKEAIRKIVADVMLIAKSPSYPNTVYYAVTKTGVKCFEYHKSFENQVQQTNELPWSDFSNVTVDYYFMKSVFSFEGNGKQEQITLLEHGKELSKIIKSENVLHMTELKRKFRNKILGFRSKTKWKMITASIIYFVIIVFILSKCAGTSTPDHAKTGNSTNNHEIHNQVTKPKKLEKYQKLTIDSVNVENGNVMVSGSTDLPDNAKVSVTFDLANTQTYYGTSDDAIVESGHYSATLVPRQIKELQKGPYLITVDFYANANNQSSDILKLVGKHGEQLKGTNAKSDQLGGMELEANKTVNLKLSITPPKPSTDGNFSWDNPVSAAYLKQFLSFMNDYFNGIQNQVVNPDQTEWGSYVSGQNSKGWAMYQKVNYQTNEKEDPNIYRARSDAAQAWVFLNAYEQGIDSKYFGDGSQASTLSDDQQQFKQYYNQALTEAGNIQ